MPLDPRARRFLDMLGAGSGATATIEQRRQAFALLLRTAGAPPPEVHRRDDRLPTATGELPIRVYTPHGETGSAPGLVFFHGGGFVSGDLDTHDGICSRLAAAAGCRLVAVSYRLAPEAPFPAAVEDAGAAAAAVADRAAELGIDRDRLAIGGDSVGANLAATACRVLRDRGAPVRAQLLICPVLDAARGGDSHRLFERGYFLDAATLEKDAVFYGGAGGLDPHDPRVSPLHAADLSGLPPAIIETAEFDPVRDDGARYAERLRAAGVPVRYTCHPGMIHLFYGFGRMIPQGQSALDAIGARLGELLVPNSL